MDHKHHHHQDTPTALIPKEYQALCPVTGDQIDTREAEKLGHVREHDGQETHFCCATCVHLFDAHPDKYVTHKAPTITLILKEKENLVDNVWAFRFAPSQPMAWTPGQFIRVELPHDDPDSEGTKRFFTVSSAPSENIVQITTRVTDTTFKQALNALPIGGELKLLDEPDGDFVWRDSGRPLVFIAGGIGITPFYSIIKQRIHDSETVPVTLIYSGRDDNLPFKDEINNWANSHPEFVVKYVIGERLTAAKITDLQPNANNSLIYVSGPEPMVESLGVEMKSAGLPNDQLEQDFFPNYSETNY
jgi:ferredoxin-NADP reductase/YHS domain-containing protein